MTPTILEYLRSGPSEKFTDPIVDPLKRNHQTCSTGNDSFMGCFTIPNSKGTTSFYDDLYDVSVSLSKWVSRDHAIAHFSFMLLLRPQMNLTLRCVDHLRCLTEGGNSGLGVFKCQLHFLSPASVSITLSSPPTHFSNFLDP